MVISMLVLRSKPYPFKNFEHWRILLDSDNNASWISAVLRLAAFSLFFANAVGKFIGGSAGLVEYFHHIFQSTWLPSPLVTATAYVTPYVEMIFALWLLLGTRLRIAWICASLYMITLAFGMAVAQQYDTAAHNYLYVLLFCAGLYFSAQDRWHLGK
jgi:uncharacterized membrane protein YphA (DoxX/SURF4 family)